MIGNDIELDAIRDEIGDEAAWAIVTRLSRINAQQRQLLAGTGARDVQQVALFANQCGNGIGRGIRLGNFLQFLHPEQRTAQLNIRPTTLLQSDYPHAIPLQPLSPMHRHHAHPIVMRIVTGIGDGLGRNGLVAQSGHETRDPVHASVPLANALGRIEQRDHRIEIVVGRTRSRQGGLPKPFGPPVRCCPASPGCPQDLGDRRSGCYLGGHCLHSPLHSCDRFGQWCVRFGAGR